MVLTRKRVVCPLQVGGEVLPQVEQFGYLVVMSEGKMEGETDSFCRYAAGVPDHHGEERT